MRLAWLDEDVFGGGVGPWGLGFVHGDGRLSILLAWSGVRYLIDMGTRTSEREEKRREREGGAHCFGSRRGGVYQPWAARLASKRSDHGCDKAYSSS